MALNHHSTGFPCKTGRRKGSLLDSTQNVNADWMAPGKSERGRRACPEMKSVAGMCVRKKMTKTSVRNGVGRAIVFFLVTVMWRAETMEEGMGYAPRIKTTSGTNGV